MNDDHTDGIPEPGDAGAVAGPYSADEWLWFKLNQTQPLPNPDELERLALSLALDGSLDEYDTQTVVAVLQWAAARRRHPSSALRSRPA